MKKTGSILFSFPSLSLLLIAAALPFATGVLPTVHFTSELINIHVYPAEIRVDGHYFYRNPFPFPVLQGFSVPFPVDRDHPEPLDVRVERLSPVKEELKVKHSFGNTGFEVYFSANEAAEIRVSYRQQAGGAKATYILTTTKPWGRPLDSGVYALYPHGTSIVSSNYPLDLPGSTAGFRKTGFMPDKDWQFSWRREDEKGI